MRECGWVWVWGGYQQDRRARGLDVGITPSEKPRNVAMLLYTATVHGQMCVRVSAPAQTQTAAALSTQLCLSLSLPDRPHHTALDALAGGLLFRDKPVVVVVVAATSVGYLQPCHFPAATPPAKWRRVPPPPSMASSGARAPALRTALRSPPVPAPGPEPTPLPPGAGHRGVDPAGSTESAPACHLPPPPPPSPLVISPSLPTCQYPLV